MSEKSTAGPQNAEQIQLDEIAAYAIKPEMDLFTAQRLAAPRTGMLALRDGQITMIEGPQMDERMAKEHAIRRFYAEKDAQAALSAERVLRDPAASAKDIVRADQGLKNLTSHDRAPRPSEQIQRSIENR